MGEWRKTRGRFFASLKNDRDAGVKCGRRGAVRAATANRGLRFLGFARNDRGALWWNDRRELCQKDRGALRWSGVGA